MILNTTEVFQFSNISKSHLHSHDTTQFINKMVQKRFDQDITYQLSNAVNSTIVSITKTLHTLITATASAAGKINFMEIYHSFRLIDATFCPVFVIFSSDLYYHDDH